MRLRDVLEWLATIEDGGAQLQSVQFGGVGEPIDKIQVMDGAGNVKYEAMPLTVDSAIIEVSFQ